MSTDNLIISRAWAMPSPWTFSIKPIASLLDRWLEGRSVIVDPFSGQSTRGTYRNDLANGGMNAVDWCAGLHAAGVLADAILLDPPYSPRQMAEVYKSVGRKGMEISQTAKLYSACKDALTLIARRGTIAITFGWSSVGFGLKRGWEQREILLVCHGGAHNDTICVVEEKT